MYKTGINDKDRDRKQPYGKTTLRRDGKTVLPGIYSGDRTWDRKERSFRGLQSQTEEYNMLGRLVLKAVTL